MDYEVWNDAWNYKQYGSLSKLVIAVNLPTQWCSRRGGKWEPAPWGAVLESASTYLIQPFKNVVLTQNSLDQIMPKIAYFWKKTV